MTNSPIRSHSDSLVRDAGQRLVWLTVNSSYSHASLALPMLHATCLRAGLPWKWRQVVCSADAQVAPLVAEIVQVAPRVLLATCYLFNRETVLKICRRVKALLPELAIFLGGPEFLGPNADFLRREPSVDGVVRGEGEAIIVPLLECLGSGMRPVGLAGVCFRDTAGEPVDDGSHAPDLPFAELADPLLSPFFDRLGPFVQLESSRGCFGSCCFCTSGGTSVRNGSVDSLAEKLVKIRDAGITEVRLLDRTFNASPDRSVKLLELFQRDFPDLRFHLELHPGFLPARVRKALSQAPAGQLHIEAGVQSSVRDVLEQTGRAGGADVWDGVRFLSACGNLAVHVDFIAGLPGQTACSLHRDIVETIGIGPAEIQLETLKILPGTVLSRQPVDIVFAPDPPYEVLKTAAMSAVELEEMRLVSVLLDRFYNARPLQSSLRHAVAERGVPRLLELAAFLESRQALAQPMALANRFKVFHAFARLQRDGKLMSLLEYAWLRWGLSPQHGLREAQLWKNPVPSQAVLVEGVLMDAPAKIWQADIGGQGYLFIFDRQRRKQPAQAVLKL